jgi:hypothetical protein
MRHRGAHERRERPMDLSRSMELCAECERTCMQTAVHCLAQGGALAERDHIRTLWDCAETCHLAAALMSRGSPSYPVISATCVDLCEVCADACRQSDDPHLQRCAEIAHECAASCRELALHRSI